MKAVADDIVRQAGQHADGDRIAGREQPGGAANDGQFLLGAKDRIVAAFVPIVERGGNRAAEARRLEQIIARIEVVGRIVKSSSVSR